MMEPVVVGIGVSKNILDVHIHPSGTAFPVACTAEGLDALIAEIKPLNIGAVATEASCCFAPVVAASLGAAGLPVIMLAPDQLHAFALTCGESLKTGTAKGAVIAQFVEATKPELRSLTDEETQTLFDFVVRRRTIVHMLVTEKQCQHRLSYDAYKSSEARIILSLQKELDLLDRGIDNYVRSTPIWREKENLSLSLPDADQTMAQIKSEQP